MLAAMHDDVVRKALDEFYARCGKPGQCANGGEACDGKS